MAKIISSLPGSTGVLSKTSQLINDGETGISTYVELNDLSTVATTGDYNNLINIPIDFTPKVHTHNISDISGTKSEFNTSLIDGNFLFVGDVSNTPDATTTSKGVIKLAGDLAGTADAPTVPGLANKVDKVAGKSLIDNTEITRLTTLSNYTHPTNHPPSIITQDASNRFVTDVEKTAWNAKQGALGFTPENVANKSDSYTTSSSTAYVSGKALVEGLGTKQNTLTNPVTGTFVAGRVPYSSSNSTLTDSSKLLWNNTNSSFEVNGNAPRFTLKNNLNNFSTYFTNDAYGTLFLKNHQDKTLAAFNNPVNSTEQPQMAIGKVSSIPVESQLYVYGGMNGANIDARGSIDRDEANIDLEGNDWETSPNSLGFSYFGSSSTAVGTMLGYPKNKLGIIRFQETNYAIINSDKSTGVSPIRFGINQIEIGNINDKGFSYQSDFSSVNISNPRWLADKGYVDTKIPLSEKGTINGVATLGSDGKVPNSQIPALTTANITDSAEKRYQTDNQKLFNDATSSIQTQLNGKQNNLVSGTNIKTIEGKSLLGSGNIDLVKADVGLSNVDNTSDSNKPISTATQTALNLKENAFTKNTAFNKNFGTAAGTVAEGNDSRILNGQTAFGWGNHTSAGYALTTGSNINQSSFRTALGLGSNAYSSTAYLPLTGGTLSGIVDFNQNATFNANALFNGSLFTDNVKPNTGNTLTLLGGGANNLQVNGAATFSSTVTASNGTLIGGTLTSGYIPKATGENSLGNSAWQESATGGRLFDETDDGANKLQVNGSGFFNSNLNIKGSLTSVDTGEPNKNTAFRIEGFSNPTSSVYETRISFSPWNYNGSSFAFREALSLNSNLTATFASTVTATSFNGSATLTDAPTAPTAAVGTTGNQIATLDYVRATRPYKVYTALLSQSGTNAPTATVLENTLGGTIVWSRAGAGIYNGTLSGAFTTDKTQTFSTANLTGVLITAGASSTSIVGLNTQSSSIGVLTDGFLNKTSIEIRVYN